MRAFGQRRPLITGAAVLCALTSSVGASGSSAPQHVSSQLRELASAFGGLKKPCRQVAPACLQAAERRTRSASVAAADLTSSDSQLHAWGLPSLRAVEGADAAQARAVLNRQLVGILTRPLARRKAAARASSRGASDGGPTGVVGAVFERTQQFGGSTRLLRTVRLVVQTDACPKMTSPQNTNGKVRLEMTGFIGLTAYWARGTALIERSISVALPEFPRPAAYGYIEPSARYGGYDFREEPMVVVARERVKSPGKPVVEREVRGDLAAKTVEGGGWRVRPGPTFDIAMDRWAQTVNDDPPVGPPPWYDLRPQQLEAATRALGQTLINLLDAELSRVIARAQRDGWQKANACAAIAWSPPSDTRELQPGETLTLQGRVLARRGGLDGYSTWPETSFRQYAGRIQRALTASSRDGQPMKLVVQAGKPVGEFTVRFVWRTTSTVGVAETEWTSKGTSELPPAWVGTFTTDIVDIGGIPAGPQQVESKLTGNARFDKLDRNIYWRATGKLTLKPETPECSGEMTNTDLNNEFYRSYFEFDGGETWLRYRLSLWANPNSWTGEITCVDKYGERYPMQVWEGSFNVGGPVTSLRTLSGDVKYDHGPYTSRTTWRLNAG